MKKVSNKPIRILQIGMHDKIGGVETFLMNYYRNIDKKKFQFDFINPYEKLSFQEEIEKLGGKVYKIPNFKKHPIKYYKAIKNIIKNNKYNIVHVHMLSAANVLPIKAAKSCDVKHIISHSHNSNTPPGVIRKILNMVNKKYIRHTCNHFLGCSLLASEWLYGAKFCKNNNIIVINNAIDYDKFCYNDSVRKKIREQLKVDNELLFGHVGRFSYQKNHNYLIELFNEIHKANPKTKLILIGDGELRKKIELKVNDYNLQKSVIFLGVVSNVNDYFQAMDVFLLPSWFEGLPVVGVEAQISSTKCVFSSTITKEIDITNNNLFIDINNDAKDNAKNILNFAKKEKNIVSRRNVSQYDIQKESKKLESFYKDISD